MRPARYAIPAAFGVGVVVLTIALMWVFGVALFSSTTAETRGKTGVREDTVADAGFRIAAYERFYDLCASVQSTEGRIAALQQELDGGVTDARKAQIDTTLTALRGQRAEQIAEYNAEARKVRTVAQFQASDLPPELDPDEETTCTAAE